VQINFSTRHGHLGEETRTKITEKVGKLSRLFDRLYTAEVTVDLEQHEAPRVDLKIDAKHKEFVATAQASDLLAAVDAVIEKMKQQLRRHKDKVRDRHRGSGRRP
jgi:putative sigma-54 modulation protein